LRQILIGGSLKPVPDSNRALKREAPPNFFIGSYVNKDAGTEDNQPLGSGLAGGQPDSSKGEENIENGVSTEEPVSPHPQLTEIIMRVSVIPVEE
jgi:hypothetical protein